MTLALEEIVNQWNTVENTEIGPWTHDKLIFNKDAKNTQ